MQNSNPDETLTGHSVHTFIKYLILWRSLGESNPCFSLERALAAERAKGLEIAAELAVARAKASEGEALMHSRSCRSPS